MTCLIEYDKTDPKSIETYSQRLIGKTFADIIEEDKKEHDSFQTVKERGEAYGNTNRKGGLGEIIEECLFHYKTNTDSRPDFHEAGVELKVTPYKKIKKNSSPSLVAKNVSSS